MKALHRITSSLLALCIIQSIVLASDWPQYRGPNRDGRSSETDLLKSWPDSGPEVLWRSTLGSGYSGMAVVDDRVFTMFGDQGDEYAAAFDAATGEELWRFKMGRNLRNDQGNGPRATPTVDGDLVFVMGARSKLYALEVATGELRWGMNLEKELGAKVPEWGTATSPLIEGQYLIVDVAGRTDHGVVAFDKETGEELWEHKLPWGGYAPPATYEVDGRQYVVIAATGGGKLGGPMGDAYVAFALPEGDR